MTKIDGRVLEIAETAWAMIKDRNDVQPDTTTDGFEEYVYEATTDFLIGLDQAFKASGQL